MQLALSATPKTRARGAGAVVVLASGVVAFLALRSARAAPELGHVAWSAWGAAPVLVPGLAAVGVALEWLHRRRWDRCALLVALAGIGSFLPELSVPGTRPALAFSAGLVLAWAAPPLVGHLALVYPGRPTSRPVRVLRDAGYLSAIVGLGLLPALVFDPVETGCGQCSSNLVLLHASSRLEAPLTRAGVVATLAWATLCVAAIGLRLAHATPAARRLLWPVLVPAAPGRATTALRGLEGEPEAVALLRHREGLLDDPALIEEVTRAARLPLANERLRADAQARLALLQASRKRIVAAADAERQRLERNLHDGAQQRLVSLGLPVRAARTADGR